jgi:hypothetical protein
MSSLGYELVSLELKPWGVAGGTNSAPCLREVIHNWIFEESFGTV